MTPPTTTSTFTPEIPFTVSVTSGTKTINVTSTADFYVGALVTGTNIPAGDYITAISGNQITLNVAPTGTSSSDAIDVWTSQFQIGSGNGTAGTITINGTETINSLAVNPAGSGNYTITGGSLLITAGTTPTLLVNSSVTIGSLINITGTTTIASGATLTLTGGTGTGTGQAIESFDGLGIGTNTEASGNTAAVMLENTASNPTAYSLAYVLNGSISVGESLSAINTGDIGDDSVSGGLTIGNGVQLRTSAFNIGYGGSTGVVTVDSGGQLYATNTNIAVGRSDNARLIVNGGNVATYVGYQVVIAQGTAGEVDVINGGTISTGGIIFNGNTSGSTANLYIDGPGSDVSTGYLQFGTNEITPTTTSGTETANVEVATGGVLALGSGGIYQASDYTPLAGALSVTNIVIEGGTVEATGSWSTPMAITLTSGSGANTFEADNGAGTAYNITLGGQISGNGGLTKTGAGTLTLNAANSYTGGTTINAGRVVMGSSPGVSSATVTPLATNQTGGTALTFGSGVSSFTVSTGEAAALGASGSITGTGIPAGTDYTVSGTTVSLVNASGASVSTTAANSTTAAGYTIYAAGAGVTAGAAAAGVSTITFSTAPANLAVGMEVIGTNIVAGTYIMAINGNTITLSAPVGSGGVSSGAVFNFGGLNQGEVTSTTGIGAGQTVTVNGSSNSVVGVPGSTVVTFTNDVESGSLAQVNATSFSSYTGTLGSTSGVLTVNSGGTLDFNGTSQEVGTFSGTGGAIINDGTGVSIFTVGNGTASAGANGTFAGTISDHDGSGTTGTVALTKIGSNTQILSGANTYSGGTTVTSGELLVENASGSGIGTGNATVASGAILGGTGTIALASGNSITVQSGGILLAGDGVSTTAVLTIGGSGNTMALNVSAGGILEFVLGTGNQSSSLAFASGATESFNAATILQLENVSSAGIGTYVLMTGLTSDPGNESQWTVDGLSGYTDSFIYNSGVLSIDIAAVPEPGTWCLLLLGALGIWKAQRKRSASV